AITPHGLGLVRVDSLWGVVDSMGSMKLKPRFNSYYVRSHFNQRFFLKRDTTYSMVSAKGKILHRGVYDDMPYEFGNFIYIRNKNKEGILSNSGKVLIPIKYDQLEYTWPNWFIAEQNNKFGIIDTLEREIVPIEFDHIYSLKRNFVCQKNQKIYFFNGSGPPFDINVDGVFPYGNPYHDNEILATKNEQYGLLKSGQWLIAPSFDTIIRYLDYHIVHQNGKVGYFNEMGLEIIPPEYDKITMRGKNFIVEKQNQFGVLNQDGANIISVECDSVVLLAWNKSGGYACCFAALRNNVWTIYDNRGYPISSTKYDLIGSLPQNTFYLKKDGKYQMGIFYNGQLQLFDKSFSYLDQLGYSNLVTFRDSSEKMGLISTDGTYLTKYNIRFESIFSDIKDVYLSGAYLVELEGKYGIINSRGRYTFEPIYDRYEKSPFEHSRQTYIYLFKNNRKYKAQLNGMLTPEDL
ncbi:MAG: WG repeat-containing protein, partial [Flavobacteriales bacterium]|nr:WG repeat-containing protein [Flavobacteriales bacterium]